ncbi:hypothetical protein Bca4012_008946 [Brassica carinata]
MFSAASDDQGDDRGYSGPAWLNPIYTQTHHIKRGKVVPSRKHPLINGREGTTSTVSRAMLGGSVIKENMV